MTEQAANSSSQTAPNVVDTQGARRATEVSTTGGAEEVTRIASEVLEKAVRRRFTAEYKHRILNEADACTDSGDIGALLRREGLYSSHLSKWRAQREQAIRESLSKARGRKPVEKNPLAEENARLQKENQRLQDRLTQAQTIIEVQKTCAELVEVNFRNCWG